MAMISEPIAIDPRWYRHSHLCAVMIGNFVLSDFALKNQMQAEVEMTN